MTLTVKVRRQLGEGDDSFTLDADFVSEGRVTALFGRSGSGKSTLINLIAGLLRPDSGLIRVDDTVLFDSGGRIDLPTHRRRLGYVFQEGRLFPHLSIRANLLYGQRFTPRSDRWAVFSEVVDLLGIGHLLDRRPASLSGGEKQRVAIGRALLSSPRLLLMDEPLAALDEQRKAEILPFIERLRDRMHLPIVYVSHSVEEVSRIADTVVLLRGGRTVAIGPVNAILGRGGDDADGFDPGTVLAATVTGHDPASGMTQLIHPAGRLSIPQIPAETGTPVRIRIRARDVALAVGEPGRLSIRNRLAATVREISEGSGPVVEIHLDIAGDPLVASITRDSVRDLGLAPGSAVTALIKSASFDPLAFGAEEKEKA